MDNSKKKVMVTGGAGYIGGHLCRLLLDRGYKVVVLDSFLFGDKGIRDLRGHRNLELVVGDVRHIEDVAKTMRGAYAVIHLAAIVGDPACEVDEDVTRTVNIESTKTLVELANLYEVSRLLFSSSCSVYGAAPRDVILNEGSYLNPVSLYAETRIVSEEILKQKADGPVVTSLRLATVFGWSWRMRFDLVTNQLTAMAVKDGVIRVFGGEQSRPFLHCRDAARAFVMALEADGERLHKEEFNVGSNDLNLTIKDLAQTVADEVPDARMESIKTLDDQRNYRVDFTKIKWLLNFKTEYSIPQGCREMAERLYNGEYDDWSQDVYHNYRYNYRI
jgi:nucleoside-diphosphate-sugar epimerase